MSGSKRYQAILQIGSGKHTVEIEVSRELTQTEQDEMAQIYCDGIADTITEYCWNNLATGAKVMK